MLKKILSKEVNFVELSKLKRGVGRIRNSIGASGELKDQVDHMHNVLRKQNEMILDQLGGMDEKIAGISGSLAIALEKIDAFRAHNDQWMWLTENSVIKNISASAWVGNLELKRALYKKFPEMKPSFQAENRSYDYAFYHSLIYDSYISAKIVLRTLLARYPFDSIVDFGCGLGAWLYAAKEYGAREVHGIDGEYTNLEHLLIEPSEFSALDLRQQVDLGKRFDVAMSVEVVEHIDDRYSDVFIDNLCRHADRILFSGAYPGQGGVDHVNEQPLDYWTDKFGQRGYALDDCIRPLLQDEIQVGSWYRSNIVVFVKRP